MWCGFPSPMSRELSRASSPAGDRYRDAVRSLAWRVVAVFVVAVAVISQGLETLRSGLGIGGDVFALAQYGPALAALVTWLVFRSRIGEVVPALINGRQGRINLALALAACLLFTLLLWVGYAVVSGRGSYGVRSVSGTPFPALALVWLLGATAEEIGWRGVLQPTLEVKLPRWGAGLATGLLWSVWHLPVVTQGAAIAATFIASTTAFAVLLAYLGTGSPCQRVAVTSVVHWVVNLAILIIAGTDVSVAELIPELVAVVLTTAAFLPLFARFRTGRISANENVARVRGMS